MPNNSQIKCPKPQIKNNGRAQWHQFVESIENKWISKISLVSLDQTGAPITKPWI